MKIMQDLLYTESHEWVKFTDETTALVGLTDFAQNSLGGLVFINLPSEGDGITAGESLGDVESVKAVSDIYSPLTGKVKRVNGEVIDNPALINDDPYAAWLVEAEAVTEKEKLMSPSEYEKYCEGKA